MSDAIKTISLDDIGDPGPGDGAQGKNKALHYNPQYFTSSDTSVTASHALQMRERSAPVSSQSPDTGTRQGTGLRSSLTRFSAILQLPRGQSDSKRTLMMGLLLLVLAAGAYVYLDGEGMLGGGENMLDTSTEIASESDAAAPAETGGLVQAEPTPAVEETPSPAPTSEPSGDQLSNPYWYLPNPLESAKLVGVPASASQVETWRVALAHPFVYQRYKTVKAMRGVAGSEALLRDSTSQSKFWTRMEAVVALAEHGEEVDVDTLQASLANTRKDLVKNYFRRFSKESKATAYVMRQALRVADASAREVILQNLARQRNATNDLYLIAATFDPNPKIKSFAEQELRTKPTAPGAMDEFKRALAAGVSIPSPNDSAATSAAGEGQSETERTQDITVEKMSNATNVEEVYFLNDDEEEAVPVDAEPVKDTVPVDDGFDDLENAEEEDAS